MAKTYRQCGICLSWRTDVGERMSVRDNSDLCSHCFRIYTAKSICKREKEELYAPPQKIGKDSLARLENLIKRGLQQREKTNRVGYD
jgi:hypothetical protein